jgi:hypothetical protein
MRRKVLQDFANTVSQRLLDSPEGFDLAAFAHRGSGTYRANLLSGVCTYDGQFIPSLHLCCVYKDWLIHQSKHHGVAFDAIESIDVEIAVAVREAATRVSYRNRFASAHFELNCRCEIKTDEKTYVGKNSGEKEWGFDSYYEKVYGTIPDSWPHLSN